MAYTQVTLATLRTRLQAKFESVPFFTLTEQDAAINEALQWYNLYTGVWRRRVETTSVANQVYYPLAGSLVYNCRIEWNGVPLTISSLGDLDNGQPGWEGETTASGGLVPTSPQVWAPLGMNYFALWPADATGDNGIIIDGVYATPTLSNPGDFVDMDDTELDALLGEALYLLCFKDPGRAPRVAQWHTNFLQAVLARNGRLRAANAFIIPEGLDLYRSTHPMSVG